MKLKWILGILLLAGACSAPEPGEELRSLLSPHAARLAELIAVAERRANTVDGGRIEAVPAGAAARPLPARWREAEANLYLSEAGPTEADAVFLYSGLQAKFTRIVLNSVSGRDMDARIICDGDAQLYGVQAHSLLVRAAGRGRNFVLPAESSEEVYLKVGPQVKSCRLDWGGGNSLRLQREELARPALARLDSAEVTCTSSPGPARMDALQAAFYADRWLTQTCARPTGKLVLVQRPLEALNARIEALTGARVSEARLLAGDPDMVLDYSDAPKLELIYVSYLLMRADYSGYLMRRMLAWHAARGTIIRILLTDKLMMAKDRALFEGLAAQYPNVQIQYFKWARPGLKGPSELINLVQRGHHIKAFVTLSPTPGRSRFIIGGRNIFDGFFFERPIDLSSHPELRTYDEDGVQGLTYYSIYEDFEVELRGDRVVRDFAAHLSTFWHRDMRTQSARPMAVQAAPAAGAGAGAGASGAGAPPRGGQVRHFMSLPWVDARAQEAYFAELLDAAQSEIILVTPFMYPPPAIVNAMLRARARGVRVRVVVRINSTDPSGSFITALNHGFVQRWAGDFEVYEYVPGRRMMHTKLILIDGRLSVVTSTNLNRRSFVHDSENGVVFLDRAVTARLRDVVEGYLQTATRMQPGGELSGFDRVMNELTDIWQYF